MDPATPPAGGTPAAETPVLADPAAQPSIRDIASTAAPPAQPESEAGDIRNAAVTPAADPLPSWAEGIPEHMRGETAEDTLAKVSAAYQGLRTKVAKGETAADLPESADGYHWQLPDAYTKAAGGDVSDDPMIAKFGELAHQHGIGQEAAGEIINGVLETALENGMVEAPMSMEQFYEELGGKEAGDRMAGDAGAWARNLMAQGALGPIGTAEEKAAAEKNLDAVYDMIADSPQSLRVLDMIRRSQGAPSMALPKAGDAAGAPLTMEALNAEVADPRYDSSSPQFSPMYRKRVDARFAAFEAANRG